ncbi:MAG: hypothetical protein AABY54_09030 [Deltaproteobacteria bacterium]
MATIEKTRIMVRVTTSKNVIEGYLNKTEQSRTLDILNSKDKFMSITDAKVINEETKERRFVAVNMGNIITVEEI